ncbi:MAG: hypothetical protein KGI46_04095 [Alphaproteobacteria bacterium]|nr:hypothetical protein [Alphaproteobacteria bacterium]
MPYRQKRRIAGVTKKRRKVMQDGFALLVLIAIVAGVFWLGFRLGYRYRAGLSQERQKKYRTSKAKIAVAHLDPAVVEHEPQAGG